MPLFVSTHINKIDKKGRVSVPSQFRAELAEQSFQGVVLFKSNSYEALEGFAWSYMSEIGKRLDNFDMFSSEQDDLATAIFGESVQLPFDGDGRIIIPSYLLEYADLSDSAAFVGMGSKFQIWDPHMLDKRKKEARDNIQAQGLVVPKGGVV